MHSRVQTLKFSYNYLHLNLKYFRVNNVVTIMSFCLLYIYTIHYIDIF